MDKKRTNPINCAQRYLQLLEEVKDLAIRSGRNPQEICLVAVSKGHPSPVLQGVYEVGCRDFGENRLFEAFDKQNQLPSSIQWHFIGTLQRNKVAKVVNRFALIHSVDSVELAQKLSWASQQACVQTSILLQVNISGETTKHGLSVGQWQSAFDQIATLSHLSIKGLMTMAPLTLEEKTIRATFSQLRAFRDRLQQRTDHQLHHLSMGMSHDYKVAIEEGATLLRVGSAIFGDKASYI